MAASIQRYLLAFIVLFLSTWNDNVIQKVDGFGILFMHFFVCKKIKKSIQNAQTQDCKCKGKIKLFSTLATINLNCQSISALCLSPNESSCFDGNFTTVIYVKKKESILNVTIPMNKTIFENNLPSGPPDTPDAKTTIVATFPFDLGALYTNYTSEPKYLQNSPNFTFSSCTAFFSPNTACTCNICDDKQSFIFDCSNKKLFNYTAVTRLSNGTTIISEPTTAFWPNQTFCVPVTVTSSGSSIRLSTDIFASMKY